MTYSVISPGITAAAFTVTGRVTAAETGAPVDSATVTLVDLDAQEILTTTTDVTGQYSIEIPGITGVASERPETFRLAQNFPNPFNPTTTIEYELDAASHVRLDIFSVTGQRIRTLVDGTVSSGVHRAVWDGCDDDGAGVGAGVYLYRLAAGGNVSSRKMLLVDGGGVQSYMAAPVLRNAATPDISCGITVNAAGYKIFSEIKNLPHDARGGIDVALDLLDQPGDGDDNEARLEKYKNDHPISQIWWDSERQIPSSVIAPDMYLPGITTVTEENVFDAAMQLLAMYPKLFPVEHLELQPRIITNDDGAIIDLLLSQSHHGIRVSPGSIRFRFTGEKGNPRVGWIDYTIYNDNVTLNPEPFIQSLKAWEIAADYFGKPVSFGDPDNPEHLIIVQDPSTKQWRLTWLLVVEVEPAYLPQVFIDAHSGEVYQIKDLSSH